MSLKSLKDANAEVLALFKKVNTRECLNGIACPTCDAELLDDLTCILTSNPPQVPIFCKVCGYHGSRF